MFKALRNLWVGGNTKEIVLDNVRRNNGIVFGATASQFHMGANARPTKDVDAFVPYPQRVAKQTEAQLDKNWGADQFYTKPAKHRGTWKVKNKGWDGVRGTADDQTVADFSPMPKPLPPHSMHTNRGIKVVNLSHVKGTKKKSLSDKRFKFRHAKDQEDVDRIDFYGNRL